MSAKDSGTWSVPMLTEESTFLSRETSLLILLWKRSRVLVMRDETLFRIFDSRSPSHSSVMDVLIHVVFTVHLNYWRWNFIVIVYWMLGCLCFKKFWEVYFIISLSLNYMTVFSVFEVSVCSLWCSLCKKKKKKRGRDSLLSCSSILIYLYIIYYIMLVVLLFKWFFFYRSSQHPPIGRYDCQRGDPLSKGHSHI